MKIKNSTRWVRNPVHGYLAAIAAFLIAWMLRTLLHPFLQERFPGLFFFIGSVVVAYRYGLLPSLLCIALAAPVTLYFFVPPFGSWAPIDPADMTILIFYAVATLICATFFELLNRERYNSDLIARVADSRYRIMVALDEDRRYHQGEWERMSASGNFHVSELNPGSPPTAAQ